MTTTMTVKDMTTKEIKARLAELDKIFKGFYANHFGDETEWNKINGDEIAEEEEILSDELIERWNEEDEEGEED